MINVVSIVEGDGEVAALPVLLRRLAQWLTPQAQVRLPPPIRVRRDQFLNRHDVFARHLGLAASKCAQPGWILILLDADDDCPAVLSEQIALRAQTLLPHMQISVVLANKEYEAWFIAAAHSLDGQRGFVVPTSPLPACETVRDAKNWMSRNIAASKYHEVDDQPAFSARIDLQTARTNSRSFRKLCTEWERQVGV